MSAPRAEAPLLHVVATPIGSLGDLSPRAREILARVEFVACEDTRHTAKLLAASGLHVPLVSLHEHNEREKSLTLLERLRLSEKREAALVTDAGTPGVSDPGSYFVGLAHEAGVRVLSAPGPSSLAAALGACGFESRRVVFSTFFPRDTKGRAAEVAVWKAAAPCVGVCFESPHRLVSALAFLVGALPEGARVCVSREISKKHEEHVRGTPAQVYALLGAREEVKGECVITVELGEAARADLRNTPEETVGDLARACLEKRRATGAPLKALAKELAAGTSFAAKEIYAAALAHEGPVEDEE